MKTLVGTPDPEPQPQQVWWCTTRTNTTYGSTASNIQFTSYTGAFAAPAEEDE